MRRLLTFILIFSSYAAKSQIYSALKNQFAAPQSGSFWFKTGPYRLEDLPVSTATADYLISVNSSGNLRKRQPTLNDIATYGNTSVLGATFNGVTVDKGAPALGVLINMTGTASTTFREFKIQADNGSGRFSGGYFGTFFNGQRNTYTYISSVDSNTTASSAYQNTLMRFYPDSRVVVGNGTGNSALFQVLGSVRTDIGSDTKYDMYYRDSATGNWSRLSGPIYGQIVTAGFGGKPQWSNPGSIFTSNNIYNTSSTLTGNRIASGSGGTYGIKWDSVAYFNILSGDQFQGFANYIHQADNFGARFSTTPSSTPFLDLTLDRNDSSLSVKVPSGTGGSKLLKMKKDTLSFDGRFKYKWGLPGVGKTIIDSTGNGDMVWRNSTPTSPGTPTFSPGGSVNSILGTGYSVIITGSGDHMKIQIVTGTGITSNGTIGNIMLSTPYSSTPVVVSSPAEIGSIGAPVGFNGTSASSIIIFNSSVLLPLTTYYFNLITGL